MVYNVALFVPSSGFYLNKKLLFILLIAGLGIPVKAQENKAASTADSAAVLDEVIIRAYEQNRRLEDVPAAVNYVGSRILNMFNNTSVVAAINSTPGIRMEERSPGSYRINIRGSSLRSPFGVRNVKIYFNDLPMTDPGGQTYLNSLGFYNLASIEIIKGPGSSLYGAGTGGVMLIQSLPNNIKPGLSFEYTTGSYGLKNAALSVTTGKIDAGSSLAFQHLESDGYRDNAAMQRNVWSWTGRYKIATTITLKPTLLYSSLYYQTPGALTTAEYQSNPKAARPGSALNAAAISQHNFIAGLSYEQTFTPELLNTTSLYGRINDLENPNLRGYDKAHEPQFGGRTVFTYKKYLMAGSLSFNAGAEAQQERADNFSYKNNAGIRDSLRYTDDINLAQYFIFAQASLAYKSWNLDAGVSLNKSSLHFERFSPAPSGEQHRQFKNDLAPRIALSKRFAAFTIYSSISRGFSPPTTAELLPTGGAVNLALNSEHGLNYDAGFRGKIRKSLTLDINAFIFNLQHAIVQRRDAFGGDYYTNSGNTRQRGIETSVSYEPNLKAPFLANSSFWISHTFHHFRYNDFKQLSADFSGKRLPGTPTHTITAGIDLQPVKNSELHLTYYYSDPVPLDDGNTSYANAYQLLGIKAGYQLRLTTKSLKLFGGIDNLLNQHYSPGSDINGFGGRYFNAAPLRNYYMGLNLNLDFKMKSQLLQPAI